MPELKGIAYVSTAIAEFSTEKLERLLRECETSNLLSGITGVLLYHDGNFMQYFEGAPGAMTLTYSRILASRQHHGIVELIDMPVSKRSFGSWEMGLARPTASELLTITTARWKHMAGERLSLHELPLGLKLLRRFWKNTGN